MTAVNTGSQVVTDCFERCPHSSLYADAGLTFISQAYDAHVFIYYNGQCVQGPLL